MQRERGRVIEFSPNGWGEVLTTTGHVYPFHSTAIADGSRRIAVDTPVQFAVVAGRVGRWEATHLTPADPG